ncbi:MAG TPA: hypothetical protein PK536_09920, partial [Ignavibacteria bacterium]|nr:hypothetical protein [Ignavibacteria bacterium]
LMQSIPDFINDKISDSELSNAVGELIETDSQFKNEYEEVSKTLSFFEKSEFPEPPDNYFNNLPVRINERINPASSVSENSVMFQNFSKAWKYIVPALTVILIALFFILRQENSDPVLTNSGNMQSPLQQTGNSDKTGGEKQFVKKENLNTDQDKNLTDSEISTQKSNVMTIKKKTNISNYRNNEINSPDQIRIDFTTEKPVMENKKVSDNKLTYENIDSYKSYPDFADIFDLDESNEIEVTGETGIEESDLLNSIESDDVNLQNEFRDLSPADQQEILNILKETKI